MDIYTHAAQQMDIARTFVLVDSHRLLGYFSLTMSRFTEPRHLRRALLLAEALRKASAAGEAAATRLIVGDAIDDAAARFYLHHGFVFVPEHPLRLYRRMRDIRASQ